jgi:hypothetical protein
MESSRNMSGGPEAKAADRKRKSATSHARGTKQKRGVKNNDKGQTGPSKFQKRNSRGKDSLDEMEF